MSSPFQAAFDSENALRRAAEAELANERLLRKHAEEALAQSNDEKARLIKARDSAMVQNAAHPLSPLQTRTSLIPGSLSFSPSIRPLR
eukprot:753561-Hanusia_phi.AAC.2